MGRINELSLKPVLADGDTIPIWDGQAGRTRAVLASSLKDYVDIKVNENKHVESGTFANDTLTLTFTDSSTIDITGFSFTQLLNSKVDDITFTPESGSKTIDVELLANGNSLKKETVDLSPWFTVGPTLALHFAGIYDDLQALQDAIATPANDMQAIVIQPSEKYYHGVGGAWVELAPVSSFHPTYVGAYDSVQDLESANPSPTKDDLAIVGTTTKLFYLYDSSKWNALTHIDLVSLDSRVTTAEGHLQDLQTLTGQHTTQISDLDGDVTRLQNNAFTGTGVSDDSGNSFADITGLNFVGAEVSDDNGDKTAKITVKPKITVANSQTLGATSATGNTLIFLGSTIAPDDHDPNVIIIGRADSPSFDPSIFQAAVDHGYAADDQGIKSTKTTDGWWVFKDIKSISGRPSDSVGDLVVFRNTVDVSDPTKKHAFVLGMGKNTDGNNAIWIMYRDGDTWTPWVNTSGVEQATIDDIHSSIAQLKAANTDAVSKISAVQTSIGDIYAPNKAAFNSAVTALINAALANYTPVKPSHGGDKPSIVYPRFYAQFSLGIPSNFTGATTSTNAEATLLRIPTTRERIFISVENDNDEASKVKGFKFNNKQEMSLAHRDIVLNGKKYRAFYTAGAISEQKVDIKVDFGQGI